MSAPTKVNYYSKPYPIKGTIGGKPNQSKLTVSGTAAYLPWTGVGSSCKSQHMAYGCWRYYTVISKAVCVFCCFQGWPMSDGTAHEWRSRCVKNINGRALSTHTVNSHGISDTSRSFHTSYNHTEN